MEIEDEWQKVVERKTFSSIKTCKALENNKAFIYKTQTLIKQIRY